MDITPLLAPVTAEVPCGADLSFSAEIDAIEEMRREDDPSLDQGEWIAALKSADWPNVARACEGVLTMRSKDLRVAGWLTDAWARLRGYQGMADGLDLCTGLIDTYWDGLHPLPEDGDLEQRIGNLRWLSGRIEHLVRGIALVTHDGRSMTLSNLSIARNQRLSHSDTPQMETSSGDDAPLTLESVWRDVTASGRAAAAHRRSDVTRARAALALLQAAVEARLGDEAPSFVAARTALDNAQDELVRLERECGFNEGVVEEHALGTPSHVDANATFVSGLSPSRMPARIESRAQAIEQLRRVATYFRATEPHSPVAYLADKAVRWAEMPLHEWLRAVIKDSASLTHLEDMLGVDKPASH